MSNDIDWDEIREDDRRLDRDYDDYDERDDRAPDDVIRDDNASTINDWLRRSRGTW